MLPGDYRALLLKPRKMTWRFVDDLVNEASPEVEGADDCAAPVQQDSTSVEVQFDLPPGAYATMALREASKERLPASRQAHIRF